MALPNMHSLPLGTLGAATGYIPITRRGEKDAAASKVQAAHRGQLARAAVQLLAARRAAAQLRARSIGRVKSDIHGGNGPDQKFSGGSLDLHRITEEHDPARRESYGKKPWLNTTEESSQPRVPVTTVGRKRSDLSRANDPLHQGFQFGSDEAHALRLADAERRLAKGVQHGRSKPGGGMGINGTECIGSAELHRLARAHEPSRRMGHGKKPLVSVGSSDPTEILGIERHRVVAGPKPISDLRCGDGAEHRASFIPEERLAATMQRLPSNGARRARSNLHAGADDRPAFGSTKLAAIAARHLDAAVVSGSRPHARRSAERTDAGAAARSAAAKLQALARGRHSRGVPIELHAVKARADAKAADAAAAAARLSAAERVAAERNPRGRMPADLPRRRVGGAARRAERLQSERGTEGDGSVRSPLRNLDADGLLGAMDAARMTPRRSLERSIRHTQTGAAARMFRDLPRSGTADAENTGYLFGLRDADGPSSRRPRRDPQLHGGITDEMRMVFGSPEHAALNSAANARIGNDGISFALRSAAAARTPHPKMSPKERGFAMWSAARAPVQSAAPSASSQISFGDDGGTKHHPDAVDYGGGTKAPKSSRLDTARSRRSNALSVPERGLLGGNVHAMGARSTPNLPQAAGVRKEWVAARLWGNAGPARQPLDTRGFVLGGGS